MQRGEMNCEMEIMGTTTGSRRRCSCCTTLTSMHYSCNSMRNRYVRQCESRRRCSTFEVLCHVCSRAAHQPQQNILCMGQCTWGLAVLQHVGAGGLTACNAVHALRARQAHEKMQDGAVHTAYPAVCAHSIPCGLCTQHTLRFVLFNIGGRRLSSESERAPHALCFGLQGLLLTSA